VGKEMPVFEDTETTVSELQDRIARTIALLHEIKPEEIVGSEAVRVSLPQWNGRSLSGLEYVTLQLMPNFYFHVATAFDIIRKNGISIGKSDYLGTLPLQD
jgi:hypothetical protein